MITRESNTEFEGLRTEVEKLNNSLSRIICVLGDNSLSEAERIERAIEIAGTAQSRKAKPALQGF